MTADWPHLTGAGGKDAPPRRVRERRHDHHPRRHAMRVRPTLRGQHELQGLLRHEPVGHSGSVAENSDYVADWIAQQTLGGPAPTETCGALTANAQGVPQLEDDAGAVPCNDLLSTQ